MDFTLGEAVYSIRMVNVGFPVRDGYGFEMVDTPVDRGFAASAVSIENLRRIKSIGVFR